MATADLSRRVSSGGAFGYYDSYRTGDIGVGTASYESGLHNTWKVSREIASGSTVEVLFGPASLNPLLPPYPYLFDVNLSFSGSIEVYGVDVGGIELRSESVTVTIGAETFTYSRTRSC